MLLFTVDLESILWVAMIHFLSSFFVETENFIFSFRLFVSSFVCLFVSYLLILEQTIPGVLFLEFWFCKDKRWNNFNFEKYFFFQTKLLVKMMTAIFMVR